MGGDGRKWQERSDRYTLVSGYAGGGDNGVQSSDGGRLVKRLQRLHRALSSILAVNERRARFALSYHTHLDFRYVMSVGFNF